RAGSDEADGDEARRGKAFRQQRARRHGHEVSTGFVAFGTGSIGSRSRSKPNSGFHTIGHDDAWGDEHAGRTSVEVRPAFLLLSALRAPSEAVCARVTPLARACR